MLVMVFVLGTVAHAAHEHNKEQQAQHLVCDYCAGLAHLGAAPSNSSTQNVAQLEGTAPLTAQRTAPSIPILSAAQPRAPPAG